MMISGTTKLIGHLGYPTESFKAPMIYNPFFEREGIDAVVVPMGCGVEDYPGLPAAFLQAFQCSRCAGDDAAQGDDRVQARRRRCCRRPRSRAPATPSAAGPTGRLVGEMFDGEGFVAVSCARGARLPGRGRLLWGAGGVGSAIADVARQGRAWPELALFDAYPLAAGQLADGLRDALSRCLPCAPARTIRPVATSSSTPRRSA